MGSATIADRCSCIGKEDMNEEITRLKRNIELLIENNGVDAVLDCLAQDYPECDSIAEINDLIEEYWEQS